MQTWFCIVSPGRHAVCVPETNMSVCLTLRAHYLHVEVSEAAGCGQGQFDHALHSDGVAVKVVEEGAVLMVVRHQPQLSPRPIIYTQTGKMSKEIRS